MAAQEYFNMGQPNGAPQPQRNSPVPRPPATTNSPVQNAPNPPYPLYDGPPPPYSPGGLRPDGAPPQQQNRPLTQAYPPEKPAAQPRLSPQVAPLQPRVQQRPATNGTSNGHIARPSLSQSQQEYDSQFRPPVRQQHSYAYSQEKQSHPQSGPPYAPQQQYYGSSLPVQSPYQNGHHERKGHQSVSFAPGRPQERYPSRSRSESRSRSRSRERDRERSSRSSQRKKKSGLNTFLGAGGGAILGDAIFPGLGTLGGALLGGFGGHEYDKNKQRARSHEVRPRERRYSDEYDHRPSRR